MCVRPSVPRRALPQDCNWPRQEVGVQWNCGGCWVTEAGTGVGSRRRSLPSHPHPLPSPGKGAALSRQETHLTHKENGKSSLKWCYAQHTRSSDRRTSPRLFTRHTVPEGLLPARVSSALRGASAEDKPPNRTYVLPELRQMLPWLPLHTPRAIGPTPL